MKTLFNFRRIVLALFCTGMLLGTSSCMRQTGCGTWGKVQAKPYNHQYASYGHFNRH